MTEMAVRNLPQATVEILLGLVLAAVALVPLVFTIAAASDFMVNGPDWFHSLGIVAAPVFVWCAQTSWRLITGRPNKYGGLLSPGVIGVAGLGLALVGLIGLIRGGWTALPRAWLLVLSGSGTVRLAWNRVRRGTADEAPVGHEAQQSMHDAHNFDVHAR